MSGIAVPSQPPPDGELPPNSLRPSFFDSLRSGLPVSLRGSVVAETVRPSLLPKLQARALSPWVVVGMTMVAVPLVGSLLVVQTLLSSNVVGAYDEAATRYEEHILPAHQLSLEIWEGQARADEYLRTKDPRQLNAYRAGREKIRGDFAYLTQLAESPEEKATLALARAEWNRADDFVAATLLDPGSRAAMDAENNNSAIFASIAALRKIEAELAIDMRARHSSIDQAHRHSNLVMKVGAALSALVLCATLFIVWRSRATIARVAKAIKRRQRDSHISEPVPAKVA